MRGTCPYVVLCRVCVGVCAFMCVCLWAHDQRAVAKHVAGMFVCAHFFSSRSADDAECLCGLFDSGDKAHETMGAAFHKERFYRKNKPVSGSGIESKPISLVAIFLIALIPDLHICLLAGLYKC